MLHDAEVSLEYLEQEQDPERFRIFWIASVALLRMVGHVLDKVESEQSEAVKQVVNTHWKEWKLNLPENRIFQDFIEDERNRVLKEYSFGFLSGEMPIVVQKDDSAEVFTLDDLLYCPIADGTYAGEDGRDIVREGIEWWKSRLNEMEREISAFQ